MVWNMSIFHGHSTWYPAQSSMETNWVTDFNPRDDSGTNFSRSYRRKISGEVWKKMKINGPVM